MKRPALRADARYRVFDEARIVDYLLLCGWSQEIRRGDRRGAERGARDALERWMQLGLPFTRAAKGGLRFDPAEVVNFLKWAGANHGDPFWDERFIANGRALVREFQPMAGLQPGTALDTKLDALRFSFTLAREFSLREFSLREVTPDAPLRLRLPLPLEDAALGDLAVEPVAPPDIDVEFTRAPGRLDARVSRVAALTRPTITLGVRYSFTGSAASPRHEPLSRSDRALYTRPDEALIRVTPRVRALATRLAGAGPDPGIALQRFRDFMLDELTCGIVDYDGHDAAAATDRVLESGWFDCQVGSALLVALCRAQDIPARLCSGYLLYAASPSHHWWAEAWIAGRGWVPFDTLASDLSRGGRDGEWRDCFMGHLDYRMKTECLPRLFNRSPGFRLPEAWRMLARADGDVTEIGLYDCDTGTAVQRDRIVVRHSVDASPDAGRVSPSVNATPL